MKDAFNPLSRNLIELMSISDILSRKYRLNFQYHFGMAHKMDNCLIQIAENNTFK